MTKISIIIPMYKVERFVEKCIYSCEKQDIPKDEYEIVCVNDGSPDNSGEVAKRIAMDFSNIKVIERTNGGLSMARNTGLEYAQGEYIFFVDSDDWIEENCLGKITKKLDEEKPDILAICIADMYGSSPKRRFSYEDENPMAGKDALRRGVSVRAQDSIVRRRFLDDNNFRFFPGIYHEDSELTPRMYYVATKVSFLNDIVYYVYQNPESISRTVNFKRIEDILTVVVPRLYDYSLKTVEPSYRYLYYNIICSSINTVLNKNTPLSQAQKAKANKLFYENRQFINAYLGSSYIRYKLEGALLKLFPKYLMSIYDILNFRW